MQLPLLRSMGRVESGMDFRPYRDSDRDACLSCCAPPLQTALAEFLKAPGTYFVMEHDDRIVGCGGFSLDSPSSATLRWGTIHPDFRRMGLGRFLLMYRMKELGRTGHIATVLADPPPEFAGFYAKQGFHPSGQGLVKKLSVCP